MAETKPIPSTFVPDAESSLIKSAFFENPVLLRTLRNALLGLELNASEKKLIGSLSDEVKSVIRKRIYPTVSKDAVPGTLLDLWTGIDLVGKSRDEIFQTIEVRKRMIKMTELALGLLDNPDGPRPDVSYDGSIDELGIYLTARNRFIGHIEFQTRMLDVVAGQKSETEEQVKKKNAQNSSK